MVKVLVLGSTGMLGNAVGKHFLEQEKYETILTYRNEQVSYGKNKLFFDVGKSKINDLPEVDYIINCVGVIKPFIHNDEEKSVYINSLFPHQLAKHCKEKGIKLLHITTDCVFSGTKGNYRERDQHDCLDFYGKSKSLGEPSKDCMVIRTSIIGEEIHKDASLISWVKSMKGKKIKGFTNHLWNGVTTKQYAKICQNVIENSLYTEGLYHVSSNPVSKFELVKMIDQKFELGITVEQMETTESVDRTLSTEEDLSLLLMRDIPSVHEQIMNL